MAGQVELDNALLQWDFEKRWLPRFTIKSDAGPAPRQACRQA